MTVGGGLRNSATYWELTMIAKLRGPSISTCLIFAAVSMAKPAGNERDPWDGFPKGSWAIVSESMTRDGKTITKVEKLTRIDDEGKRIRLRRQVEGKTKGLFDGGSSTSTHVYGFDPATAEGSRLTESAKKDLIIEGKKYSCEVKKYELKSKKREAVVTFWHCSTVSIPYRELGVELASIALDPDVLRVEVDYKSEAQSERVHVQVVSFKAERKIGGHTLVCVKEEGELTVVEGGTKGNGKVSRWLSNEVPGREVRLEGEGQLGDQKFKKIEEVVDFEVAKKD